MSLLSKEFEKSDTNKESLDTAVLPNYIEHVLDEKEWVLKKEKHQREVNQRLKEYISNRFEGVKEPIIDFLFEYYSFSPSALARWSPGYDTALRYTHKTDLPDTGALFPWVFNEALKIAYFDLRFFKKKRVNALNNLRRLLTNVEISTPDFSCYGLHEWAMVYDSNRRRHSYIPLRLTDQEIKQVVDQNELKCTHFDAYRFFTENAAPKNKYELSRETQHNFEQAACLHQNIDLYKWSHKFYPWVHSTLIWEAFKLALDARVLDMEASPYDLREYGYTVVAIETREGKKEYKKRQKLLMARSLPIRRELLSIIERLYIQLGS